MSKNKVLLIITICVLLAAGFGATYAYFRASGYATKTSALTVTTEALDEVTCTATDLNLVVTGSNMKQGAGTAAGTLANSATSALTCTATKHTSGATECTMDIKYTPTNVFTKSANNTNNKKELTLSGAGTTTNGVIDTPIYHETDMATLTSATTIVSGLKWIFSSNDTLTYTMTEKFYNYDFDQNDLANKNYKGTVSIENITCTGVTPTYETVTLNANGGSVSPSTKQVIAGYTYGNLPNASKSGSTFKGWSQLPSEYQQVEYIESSGSQYINTGVTPSNDLKIELLYIDKTGSGSNYVMGSRSGSSTINYGISGAVATLAYGAIFMGNSYTTPITRTANIEYLVTENIEYTSGSGYRMHAYINDITNAKKYEGYTGYSTNGAIGTLPDIYLFSFNTSNVHSGLKVKYLKMWKNNVLERYFIPCLNTSTSKYGLYDLKTGTFYGNNGSGNFTGSGTAYTTNNTMVTQNQNHTLIALWQ